MFSFFKKKKQEPKETPQKVSTPEPISDNDTPLEKALFAYKKARFDEVLSLLRTDHSPESNYLTALAKWKKNGVICGSSLSPIIIENPADSVMSPLLKAEIPALLKRMRAEAKSMGRYLKTKDLKHSNEAQKQNYALTNFISLAAFLFSKEQFEQCKDIVAPFEDLLWRLHLEYGYASDEPECVVYVKDHISRFRSSRHYINRKDAEKLLEILNRHPELNPSKEIDIVTRLAAMYEGKSLLNGERCDEGLKLLEDSFSLEVREAALWLSVYYSDQKSNHYDEMKSKYWTYLHSGGDPSVPMEGAVQKDHVKANELLPIFSQDTAQAARLLGYGDTDEKDEAAYAEFAADQECGEAGSMLLYAISNFEKSENLARRSKSLSELYEAHGIKWFERCRAILSDDVQAFARYKTYLSVHKQALYECGRRMCDSNNPKEAFMCFKAAADCGQLDAVLGLIYCYAKGYGTEINLEQASHYSSVLKETKNLRFTLGKKQDTLHNSPTRTYYLHWAEIGREGSRVLLLQKEITYLSIFGGAEGTNYLIKESFAKPFICDRIVKEPNSGRMENNPFFYLSVDEAIRYLGPLEEKKGTLKTKQVLSNPLAIVKAQKEALPNFPSGASDWTFSWWLRDRGARYPMYCAVGSDGALDTNGVHEEIDIGERYALWIDLDWFLHQEEKG